MNDYLEIFNKCNIHGINVTCRCNIWLYLTSYVCNINCIVVIRIDYFDIFNKCKILGIKVIRVYTILLYLWSCNSNINCIV